MKYFDESEFTQLLQFDRDKIGCKTMDNINKKNLTGPELKRLKQGDLSYLKLPDTPTNKIHADYLTALNLVEGITNHGLLFSSQEEISPEDDQDIEKQLNQDAMPLKNVN